MNAPVLVLTDFYIILLLNSIISSSKCVCTCTYIHMCICVYMCICIYTYVHTCVLVDGSAEYRVCLEFH